MSAFDPIPQVSRDLNLPRAGVAAVCALLADSNTVPFIARYRKEATGDLDEVQIRDIQERQAYLRDLYERRQTVLTTIEGQGKLTPELRRRIEACTTKSALEDLYLPYKPKRRTRATIALGRGLGPLAEQIIAQEDRGEPAAAARAFVDPDKEVADVDAALKGARDIVAERFADRADVRGIVREAFRKDGALTAEALPDAKTQRTRFEQYYDYAEPVGRVPSHRFLATRRGEREGVLRVGIKVDAERLVPHLQIMAGTRHRSPWSDQLDTAVKDAYKRIISRAVETDTRVEMKQAADLDAVDVFARNLRNLLLAAPLGGRRMIAIDPGLRTGCKCVALDATGRFLENITIYPARGAAEAERAGKALAAFVKKHQADAVAIGNGTGGREVERLARKVLDSQILVVQVNESGASIYSASDIARAEFPDLDLTIRGAISIGRRLQDPLAELVKLDPKSIGVGQYQHDVHQPLLGRKLDEVVESCVNHVGVELNTASASLLSRVAGIGPTLAKRIVEHREQHGPFTTRKAVLKVKGMGPKAFLQCAGFLRIRGAENPLDASAVHPERYGLVGRMATDLQVPLGRLMGDAQLAGRVDLQRYVDDEVGLLTLRDILAELEKPGRDPRAVFEAPKFREDVEKVEDLKPGMRLEGVVTNVTNFGAFVDIGVHQDGLVHISQLADTFVRDPASIVAPGDKVQVRVLEIDLERRRIALSCKSEAPKERSQPNEDRGARSEPRKGKPSGSGRGRGDQNRGNQARADRGKRGGPRRDEPARKPDSGFKHNPFADLLKG